MAPVRCLNLCRQPSWGPPKKVDSVELSLSSALTRKMASSQYPKPNNCQMAGERKINVEQSQELNSCFSAAEGFLYVHFNWSIGTCLNQRDLPFPDPKCLGYSGLGAFCQSSAPQPMELGPLGPLPVGVGFLLLRSIFCNPPSILRMSFELLLPILSAHSAVLMLFLTYRNVFSSLHGLFEDICLFPGPITLCIYTVHCGVDIFLFFLDWKSWIKTYFHSIPQSGRQDCFPPPPLLIHTHTCVCFYMLYRDVVIQILCIWGHPNSICVGIWSWNWLYSDFSGTKFTFKFLSLFFYFSISFFLFLISSSHLFFFFFSLNFFPFVSYLVRVEPSKLISRNKFHKCIFPYCYYLIFNKVPH